MKTLKESKSLKTFLEETRSLCENATEGPWETEVANPVTFINSQGGKICYCTVDRDINARFIAESRQLLPKYEKLVGVLSEALEFYKESTRPIHEGLTLDAVRKSKKIMDLDMDDGFKAREALKQAVKIINDIPEGREVSE